MKRIIGNISGFTLVELMVVVAIIGILSTVAIPNFKRYQAKAKTSEAKLALAAVYSNETSFLSEWDTYSTCLKDGMGIVAPPRGYYSFGFTADAQLAVATTNGAVSCITGGYSFAPVTVVPVGGSTAATTDISGGTLTSTSFTAGAAGHISADTTGLDKWTINQDKQIKNITAGF